mgnify:CR=1 FL=1
MNKEKTNQTVQTRLIASLPPAAAEPYTAPDIEVIDIELQQNILGGSLPNYEGDEF